MPKPSVNRDRRALVTFTPLELDQLLKEAARKGLHLATYLRSLVTTHPERARGAASR